MILAFRRPGWAHCRGDRVFEPVKIENGVRSYWKCLFGAAPTYPVSRSSKFRLVAFSDIE